MCDERMPYALRDKFDELAGSPQFIVEARKIESEFAGHGVKLQQVHPEMSPAIEWGFEEILFRLSTFEKEIQNNHHTQKESTGNQHQTGQKSQDSNSNVSASGHGFHGVPCLTLYVHC